MRITWEVSHIQLDVIGSPGILSPTDTSGNAGNYRFYSQTPILAWKKKINDSRLTNILTGYSSWHLIQCKLFLTFCPSLHNGIYFLSVQTG